MDKKNLLSLILLSAVLLPSMASAATCPSTVSIGSMACNIADQVVLVGRFIIVIMWVVTGILFLTAQGDPGKLNAGKMALFASIGGTILIIIASFAESFIANSFGLS